MLESEFHDTFIHIDNHTTGQFNTPAATERRTFYGNVGGVPDVRIDGKYQVVGGGDGCNARYLAYRSRYITRMNEVSNNSPVSVEGVFNIDEDGGTITMAATFTKLDAVTLPTVRGSLILVEDDCYYNPSTSYDNITRYSHNQTVTLTNVGDDQVLEITFPIDGNWDLEQLHAMAVLQETTGLKACVQAARLEKVRDYSVAFTQYVCSVPNGNGEAFFPGTIENLSDAADQLTVLIEQEFGWPADFQVEGDPSWYTSYVFPLGVGESADFTVRVQTDGVKTIGDGDFTATSTNTGRNQATNLRVFNNSYAILFVDDDYTRSDEAPYLNALNSLGYLYENWRCYQDHGNAGPSLAQMLGFDAIVWHNGYTTTTLLSDGEREALKAYLNWGGGLYYNSMDYLTSITSLSDFETDYLGIGSYTVNTRAADAIGVSGDPITDGMNLPLTWPSSGANRVDTVNPGATASTILVNETTVPCAIRNEITGGGRAVFNTVLHNVISQADPDPNNNLTLMTRILTWLLGSDPTDVPETPAMVSTRALWAGPNPWTPQTELRFRLDAAAPVQLSVVDASGRLVRTLHNGPMAAGMHREHWDGLDESGRSVSSGIYFVKLNGGTQQATAKLVVLR